MSAAVYEERVLKRKTELGGYQLPSGYYYSGRQVVPFCNGGRVPPVVGRLNGAVFEVSLSRDSYEARRQNAFAKRARKAGLDVQVIEPPKNIW